MTIINPVVNQKKKGKLTQKKYLKTKECKFTKEELETMDEFDRKMIEDKEFHDYVEREINIALKKVDRGEVYPIEKLYQEINTGFGLFI